MKTDFDIFNTIKQHLLTQRQKSMRQDLINACAYRGADGLKCAVGAIIKDEFFESSYEGYSIDVNEIFNAIELSNPDWPIEDKSMEMLSDLQWLHDHVSPTNWEVCLNEDFIFNEDESYLHRMPNRTLMY